MVLKFYHYNYCQFCKTVRNTLDELKIKHRKIEVDRDNKPLIVQEHEGTIPLIVDDKRIIGGSTNIVKYLTRKYGKSRKL